MKQSADYYLGNSEQIHCLNNHSFSADSSGLLDGLDLLEEESSDDS